MTIVFFATKSVAQNARPIARRSLIVAYWRLLGGVYAITYPPLNN